MPPLPYTRFRLFLYGKSPTLIGQRLFPPTTIITMLVAVQLHSLFNFIAVVLKGNGSICGNGVSHLSKPPLTVPPYCYPLTSDLYAWRCANMNSATTQPQATVKPHIISQYEWYSFFTHQQSLSPLSTTPKPKLNNPARKSTNRPWRPQPTRHLLTTNPSPKSSSVC